MQLKPDVEYSTLYKNIKSQPGKNHHHRRPEYSTLYKNIKSQHCLPMASNQFEYSTLYKNIKSQPKEVTVAIEI